MIRLPFSLRLGWLIVLIVGSPLANGADFKVATKVFVGEEAEEPVSENTTRFRGGLVYDFASDGGAISIFNTETGRFILLDKTRRIKTELSTRELLAYAQWVRNKSKEADDKLLRFCCSPNFKVEPAEGPHTWKFGSDVLTYRVTYDDSVDEEIAGQYRNFCDWFARLNSLTHPGSIPPFARMEVNAHLEQHRAVPAQVYLNVAPHPRFGKRELFVRSEHDFRPGLTNSDVTEIEKAERYLVTFKATSLETYRKAHATEASYEE